MTKYLPTGNEMISIPKLNEATGGIEDITFLLMQYKGLIELRGSDSSPLMTPYFCESIQGAKKELDLTVSNAQRLNYWIPQLNVSIGKHSACITYLTPIEERGFIIKIKIKAAFDTTITYGLSGCFGSAWHCINEDKPLDGKSYCYKSAWNNSLIFDYRIGAPVFSFAPMTDVECCSDFSVNDGKISYSILREEHFKEGEEKEATFFWGFGYEEVAAATSAKEMLRRSFNYEMKKTEDWLNARSITLHTQKLSEIYNTNLFFCIFYSTGITMDTEELVCATSRSTRYYVSAAYWDRDTLLWAFPAILDADKKLAKQILLYVFTRQRRNLGIHSRYIDGVVLEPGFELDELMAPLLALCSYIETTKEYSILEKECFAEGIDEILEKLNSSKNHKVSLYETFLQPTDDEIVYPYITYDNVLVWKALSSLAKLSPKYQYLKKTADEVYEAIYNNCIFKEDGKDIFAWSVDLCKNHNVYDEPPGSLQLFPYLGFCKNTDPVWINTVSKIRSKSYEYSFAGMPIAEIGCAHAPWPWLLSLCNSLLAGFEEQAFKELEIIEMDNGIACESVDPTTGECMTGAAFATSAGFLCHSMKEAERSFLHANRPGT